jgi:hypothetical protein
MQMAIDLSQYNVDEGTRRAFWCRDSKGWHGNSPQRQQGCTH